MSSNFSEMSSPNIKTAIENDLDQIKTAIDVDDQFDGLIKLKGNWYECRKQMNTNGKNLNQIANFCLEFMQNVDEIGFVGEGTFGQVWTAEINGIRSVYVEKIYKEVFCASADQIQAEVDVLSQNDCRYFPRFIFSGFNFGSSWSLLMEYIDGGTLSYHIFENESIISYEAKRTIAYQIADGLKFLHDRKQTHGDLKLDNIALTYSGDVRILDFGFSQSVKYGDIVLPLQNAYYSAPEVFQRKAAGVASDLWSYGVVIVSLLQGEKPFTGENKFQVQYAASNNPPNLEGINDPVARNFVLCLLQVHPANRLTNVTFHEYFKNVLLEPSFRPKPAKLTMDTYECKKDPMGLKAAKFLVQTALRIPSPNFLLSLR